MAKARTKAKAKARKKARKPTAKKSRRPVARKTKRRVKSPSRKGRRQPPGIADRIASAARAVAEGIEEGVRLERKAGARGGLSDG
ncbi:MAG: hypothetical protein FJX62_22425 [Alphaproteobacteria bacterium]|nr:hypothetical protein [Alphaproteobacteria bacterium]